MFKAAFVDLSCNFYDKHWVYSLNAVLRAHGVETEYLNERSVPRALDALGKIRPDLLLYSAYSFDIGRYLEFDRAAKQALPVKSILGGPGPTFDWQCHRESTVDAICIGEGETALIEFIESGCTAARNILPRGHDAPPGFCPWAELDALPFPDRDIVYRSDPVFGMTSSRQFLSGRGCPYRCTYCFNHAYNQIFSDCGKVVRKKSVGYLIDEILDVRRKYPFDTVVFQDDTFIVDKAWFFAFCEEFPKRTGLRYTCNIRANLMTEEIASALHSSGCAAVNWSIESGSDELRNNVLKRNMTREHILDTGRVLNKHRIPHRIGNLIGLPGETVEQMNETVELNIAARPTLGLANIFVPYPRLELTQYALERGLVGEDDLKYLPRDYFTRSVLRFSPEHHIRLQKMVCLFPYFVRFPTLFRHAGIRRFLLAMPRLALRVLYEALYVYMFASLYRVRTSWKGRFLMLTRYVRNLFD